MTQAILKPIRELTTDLLVESKLEESTGEKSWYIEGITLQGDIRNGNGRVYPTNVLTEAVSKHTSEKMKSGRALGELNHPKQDFAEVNLKEVSHKFVEVKQEGNNFRTRAKIMEDTPNGKIVSNLLKNEVQLGISSRGLGSITEDNGKKIVERFHIVTFGDIVHDPSAPDAFISGVMEGQQWVWENGQIKGMDFSQEIDEYQQTISKASRKEIGEAVASIMADYFKKLQG